MRQIMAKARSFLRGLIDTTPSSTVLSDVSAVEDTGFEVLSDVEEAATTVLSDVSAAEDTGFEVLLDVEEAAKLLRMHPKTLQALARSGEVPCLRIGKYWRFRASSLDAWVKSELTYVNQSRRV